MINFKPQEWYNKSDTANKDKLRPISAANLNRIENVLSKVTQHTDDMEMHWWKRSQKVELDGYQILWDSKPEDKYFVFGNTTNDTVNIYHAASVSVKTDSGTGKKYIELDNPETWETNYKSLGSDNITTLKERFFIVGDGSVGNVFKKNTIGGGKVYYCSPPSGYYTSAKYGDTANSTYGIVVYYLYKTVIASLYNPKDYVGSSDRSAYKEGWNEAEQLMYEYTGVPFEKARDSTLKIQTCSYSGSGSGNNVTLTFNFTPKIVFIQSQSKQKSKNNVFMVSGSQQVTPFPVTVTSGTSITSSIVTWGDRSVTFSGAGNINAIGIMYSCIAIG